VSASGQVIVQGKGKSPLFLVGEKIDGDNVEFPHEQAGGFH
jgi:hypothetical protein